jgi:hypothetical protein
VAIENLYRVLTGFGSGPSLVTVLQIPGITLPSWWGEDDGDDLARIGRLFNRVPGADWAFRPGEASVDSVYSDILARAEAARRVLTPSEADELADTAKELFQNGKPPEPSDKYQKYLDLKRAYEQAVTPVQKARALEEWRLKGQKNTIEALLDRYTRVTSDPQAEWWRHLGALMNANRRVDSSGSPYLYTNTVPRYSRLFDDDGWTRVELTADELAANTASLRIIGNRSDFKLWRQGASGGVHDSADAQLASSEAALSLDVKRARIDRPWLDPLVLASRVWKWPTGSSGALISDGGLANGGVTAEGLMPLQPVEVLLARNVRIRFSDVSELRAIRTSIRTRRPLSWGTFDLIGRYLNDAGLDPVLPQFTSQAVIASGVQIIAWYCVPIPKLPDPDPRLFPIPVP